MLDHAVKLGSEILMKLTGLRNLRYLSMRNCNVSQVSSEIGNLVSLQKLNLSKNAFATLPDSFSNLLQLVELQIDDCSELQYLPLLPSNLENIVATGCSSLDVMPFNSMRTAKIFRSKMFKKSLFTRTLSIGLSGKETCNWRNPTNRRTFSSFVTPMHLDKKICGAILLIGTPFYQVSGSQLHTRMLNITKETGHYFDISTIHGTSIIFIFYPLNETTLMVETGDTVKIISATPWYGLNFIYEDEVIDSAIVIQNRNLTHEQHTFRVPSEMDEANSITQLTNTVNSFLLYSKRYFLPLAVQL